MDNNEKSRTDIIAEKRKLCIKTTSQTNGSGYKYQWNIGENCENGGDQHGNAG